MVEAAQKLICRSKKFIKLHRGALDRNIVRCVKDEVGKVQKACNNKKRRRSDIEKAIDGLGKAVATAIGAVYSLRNGTAAQECEAPVAPSAASSLPVDSGA